ncbi:hypothetical protein EYF80_061236 [Liparis tanakae]|uniref:Uncharacterized protein n=1 Tax=Liparis tanakae TaxID=230148 RepID=A0A4Z2EID8_9TELE|nr:hypothetical protein EYF80_061236 [Liparis tanakae]
MFSLICRVRLDAVRPLVQIDASGQRGFSADFPRSAPIGRPADCSYCLTTLHWPRAIGQSLRLDPVSRRGLRLLDQRGNRVARRHTRRAVFDTLLLY